MAWNRFKQGSTNENIDSTMSLQLAAWESPGLKYFHADCHAWDTNFDIKTGTEKIKPKFTNS